MRLNIGHLVGVVALGAVLFMSGCASIASLAATMNERQIQSCLKYQGIVGGGMGATANVQLNGVTATGGASLQDCMDKM